SWPKSAQQAWRRHKYSSLVILAVTLAGLAAYIYTYAMEARSPAARFIDSLEVKTYDARFRLRGRTPPAPEIIIVGIDQATLARLGSWPIPRSHYARLLENLAADGARVVGFDINFPKPDDKSGRELLRRAREDYLKNTPAAGRDPRYLAQLDTLEKESDTDAALAEAIRRTGRVVLGYLFFLSREEVRYVDAPAQEEADSHLQFSSLTTRPVTDARGQAPPPLQTVFSGTEGYLAETNLAAFTEAADFRVGFFNVTADADGVVRHATLAMKYASGWRGSGAQANFYPSFDVQVLRAYFGASEQESLLVYNAAGVEAIELGSRRIPTDAQGRLLIHFQGGPLLTYPQVSFADVVEGRYSPGAFRDKIVLVGPTALAVGDFRPTPYAEGFHAGVEIHANILDTILSQRFIHSGAREELLDLLLILLLGVGGGILLVRVRPAWIAPSALVLLAAFLLMTYGALAWFHAWLNVIIPSNVLVANAGLIAAVRVLLEEREKRRIHSAFQHYIPPGLLHELMKDPSRLKLGGEERELTILFSDIRGFTSLAEKLTPLELTSFLNAYTDEMTEIIFRHLGTLDKYQGDAVMAFWGAPYETADHAARACAAAVEMSRRVDELRARWRSEGRPDINVGIGISTGRVVVGNMGSRKRFNYTVLGDAVNLASRLEGVNKEYSTRILVSESTYQQVAGSASSQPLVFRQLDWIRVKGKHQPVAIYELLGSADDSQKKLLELYDTALQAYRGQQWAVALAAFEAILRRHPDDGPAQLMAARCRAFRASPPPPDWDGVYEMKTK
ncbi:MAG TPA: adenylate/guanylate cyclase domain-containing protein, partial [Candidatus Acidoferrales bacterium]|nr:adenylate/guanylate cyclase domain-containing protein [Candidatus Acidoferrales bacterium]